MKNKLLNEELRRIKDMMKKINESRFFDDSGEFLGGPNPADEEGGDEYFGEEVDAFVNNNFPEMNNNLDYDYSYVKDRYGDQQTRIKITTKDGSELSNEFREAVHDKFNVYDEYYDYIEVVRSYSGPDFDMD